MKDSRNNFSTNLWQQYAVLLLTLFAIALSPAYGQQGDFPPSVAVPAITPSTVAADSSPLTITVNVKISYPEGVSLVPDSVYVLDASGDGPPVVLAQLNDDGVNGDLTAGDWIFGGTAQLNVASPRLIVFKAQATFSNNPNPVVSSAGTVEVFSTGVPFQFQTPNLYASNICVNADGNEELCNDGLMLFKPGTDYSEVQNAALSVETVEASVAGLVSFPTLNIWQLSVKCGRDPACVQGVLTTLNQEAGSSGYPELLGAEADLLDSPDQIVGQKTRVPNDPH